MQLRPYQLALIERTRAALLSGLRRLILQLPTGGGKTAVAGEVVRRLSQAGMRVAYTVPRTEILDQTAEKLQDLAIDHFVLRAGVRTHRIAANDRVVLAMAPTLARRLDCWPAWWRPHVVVVDECHYAPEQVRAAQALWPEAHFLGLSATPERMGDDTLADCYDAIIAGPDAPSLIQGGFLVPAVVFAAPSPDLSGIKRVRGDYDSADLSRRFSTDALMGLVPEAWARHASGERTIVFAASRAHGKALTERFRPRGVRVAFVDATTPTDDRKYALKRLREGDLTVLVNVGLFVEGLDMPEITCIQLATATHSLSRYLQMVGRGLRISPKTGKRRLIVIDHGGNCIRHGMPDDPRIWTLERQQRDESEPTLRECSGCGAVYSRQLRACPQCGRTAPLPIARGPRREPEHVPVELVQVSGGVPVTELSSLERKELSRVTPPRMPPTWVSSHGLSAMTRWWTLEKERQLHGYPLPMGVYHGWTEVQMRSDLIKSNA
jgi:DNA repair protein RadD